MTERTRRTRRTSPARLQKRKTEANLKAQQEAALINKRYDVPVTMIEYEAMWRAFLERQSVNFIKNKTGLELEVVVHAIDYGWPVVQMPALSERLIKVREKAQKKFDLDTAKIIAENAHMISNLRKRLSNIVGEDWSRIGFKEGELTSLTVGKFKQLVDAMNALAKSEVFLARDGAEHTVIQHTGSVEHRNAQDESSGKLDALAHRMSTVVKALEQSGLTDKDPIVIESEVIEEKTETIEEKGE